MSLKTIWDEMSMSSECLLNLVHLIHQTASYRRRSFKYSGAMLWNDLSFAAKSASTLDRFKKEI